VFSELSSKSPQALLWQFVGSASGTAGVFLFPHMATNSQPKKAGENPPRISLRILMVEDNPMDAVLIERQLECHGFEIVSERVEKPEQFLRALNKEGWDLILADYQMPGFGAPAALKILQEKQLDIPFIVVSGMIGEERAVEMMHAGARDYVLKDNLHRLAPSIRQHLAAATIRMERRRIESALRENKRFLSSLISNLPGAVYRCANEKARGMSFISEGCRDILGCTSTDLTLRKVSYGDDLIHSGDRQRVWNEIQAALKEKAPYRLTYRVNHHDGKIRWVSEQGRGVLSTEGELLFLEGLIIDVTDRKEAEARLEASIHEKELLLREVHHRVKNNLQIISSLLQLQSNQLQDPAILNFINESQDRIRSMALIHEKLYLSDSLARIELKDYVESLAQFLFQSHGAPDKTIRFESEIVPVMLNIDTAVPLGLMITELLTNSLKHAFVGKSSGRVLLKITQCSSSGLVMTLDDDGVGISKTYDPTKSRSLGMKLIGILASQLEGKLERLNPSKGTAYRLELLLK
jgi:PAS domain S-box-containing protein